MRDFLWLYTSLYHKKQIILIVLLLFSCCLLVSLGNAQNFKGPASQQLSIALPEKKLTVGETSRYAVEWLGITVGSIVLKVEGIENIKGYSCYHITACVFPNKFLKRLYDIEYKVDTYIDTQELFSRRFERTRRVNKEYNHVVIDFDQKKNKAIFFSEGSASIVKISPVRKKIEDDIPETDYIPYGTQDLLSSFYHFRLLDIKENNKYPINIYYNRRNWLVDMKVQKPFLREIRKKGEFSVVEILPDSQLNNYILGKRKFVVYLTTDSRHLPLEFKLGTALGPIHAVIQDPPE